MTERRRVLFVGEAVTLAHVSRPLVLAQSLDPSVFEVHFACDPRYRDLLDIDQDIRYWPINSVPGEVFVEAAEYGSFHWRAETVDNYLSEELALLNRIRPSLAVGDYRLTLPISAAAASVPSASMTNFHWSPYCLLDVRTPGLRQRSLRQRAIRKARRVLTPHDQRSSTTVFNAALGRFGLPAVSDFHKLVTAGDHVLYLDPPGLLPARELPSNHIFLGPIVWSPSVPRPSWWDQLDSRRPIIYVTLGSSGSAGVLPEVLRRLGQLEATVVVATAGKGQSGLPTQVLAADYLPGTELAALASVVICNGGSATAYQAISQGTPVIGIWSNRDQFRTMAVIEAAGAGITVSAISFEINAFVHAVTRVLNDGEFRSQAQHLAGLFSSYDAGNRFRAFIAEVFEDVS